MKLIRQGRLWQVEHNNDLFNEIGQAVQYYESKYGETFNAVAMRPELRGMIDLETCCGLKLISDTSITPGHLLFLVED